jgi:hypothetical protein
LLALDSFISHLFHWIFFAQYFFRLILLGLYLSNCWMSIDCFFWAHLEFVALDLILLALIFNFINFLSNHCHLIGHCYSLMILKRIPHLAHCLLLLLRSTNTSSSNAHCNPAHCLSEWTWSFSTAPASYESLKSFWPIKWRLSHPIDRKLFHY